jgi:hypothetical protein
VLNALAGRTDTGDEWMKKLIVIGVTTLAAMFAVLGVAPSAYAYPETTCNVDVNAQVVNSGESFTATGTSQQFTTPRASAAAAVDWEMTFNGEVRTGHAVVFKQKFTAPEVTKKTKLPLTVTAIMADKTTTCTKTVDITILPGNTVIDHPHLPNTGGPRLMLLFAGFGLVLAGGVAIRQSRKSHDAHTA